MWKSQHQQDPITEVRQNEKVQVDQRALQGNRAAWNSMVPVVAIVRRRQSIVQALGGVSAWGSCNRTVIAGRNTRKDEIVVPKGEGFSAFVRDLRRDPMLASRSDATWRAYKVWVKCFAAFLESYRLCAEPSEERWSDWVEVLADSVALLGICYSMGAIDVYASAVSAFMQDGDMLSPFKNRSFKMMIEGLRRWKGMGKMKKPPIEARHVAGILEMACPVDMSLWQFFQAKVILVIGWQLFCRAQDFSEFDLCDFIVEAEGLDITVRYAKNDPRGLTRNPKLEATGGAECPKGLWMQYVQALGLQASPLCDKVKGEPKRCSHCGPAFPSVWRHKGKREHRLLKRQVTQRIRSVFVALAKTGATTMEEALMFSAKSLRCGGVSQAAAEAVRDGVLQGHGGWLQRESLRHHDLMRKTEERCVSSALNGDVRRWKSAV